MLHTHASENEAELELVKEMTGLDNVCYLEKLGLVGPDVGLAHCIHLSEAEIEILAKSKTRLLHCPSSNMKLGSGIARIPELLERGVHVSLGADGAPCNNRLDAFSEMRHAGLVQNLRAGPGQLPAASILRMATLSGAEALGLDDEVGSLEVGKRADLVLVDADAPGLLGSRDPIQQLVYAAGPEHVDSVYIDGERVVHKGQVAGWDGPAEAQRVLTAADEVAARAFA